MNKQSEQKRIVALVLCLALLFGAVSARSLPFFHSLHEAYAHKSADVKEELESLEDAEEELREEARELEQLQTRLRENVEQLNRDLSALSAEMSELSGRIRAVQEQLTDAQMRLQDTQCLRDEQYKEMQLRIQYMYENQDSGMLELILEGESIGDMMSRMEYVSALTEYDRTMMDEMQRNLEQIELVEIELQQMQVLLQEEKHALQEKQETILTRVAQYREQITACADQILMLEQKADTMAVTAEERRELMQELLEEERQNQEQANRPTTPNPGKPGNSSGTNHGNVGSDSGTWSTDVIILATVIMCEAGNQSYEGKLAVGNVVMNRVNSPLFPNTVLEVLYQEGQFTTVYGGLFAAYLATGVDEEFYQIAQTAIAGQKNVVPNALYFRRIREPFPEGTVIIGDHMFY